MTANPANVTTPTGSPGPTETPAALTPLTGRETEVGILADRWEQAQEGTGQIVLIVGEAGLGKSRLAQTARQSVLAGTAEDGLANPAASAPPPVIEWRGSQRFQHTGLRPVADCLERRLDFDAGDSPAARFDRLAGHLEDVGLGRPELVALFAKLLFLPPDERYPAPGLTPVREREETFSAVRGWLRAQARRQPVLFIVEDLHWIDASSLELLGQFIAEDSSGPVLTVLTFRPEFRPAWPAAAHQTSLALNRLTRRQVATLMRKSAGGHTLPDSLVAQVYQRTGGLPLLVEEFTRMIRESALFERSRAHELLPTTLQQLVMARLDRLSGRREVAQFAATLGREFHHDTLAAVAGMDESALRVELAKLVDADILHPKGQPPRCAYRFKHALLEEALYRTLVEPRRRQLHGQVAEVLEARFPLSAETQPELLAQHFTAAGRAEKATGYWLQAGRHSLERFANVEAISHLSKGLEQLETLDESAARDALEVELLGPLGTAYIAARGYAAPEVGPLFQRARALSERLGHMSQAFVMLRGHFAYHIVRGDLRLCTDLAAEAVRFGERLGDPGILMEALFLQVLARLYRGDFAGARDVGTRALADYDDRARTASWGGATGAGCRRPPPPPRGPRRGPPRGRPGAPRRLRRPGAHRALGGADGGGFRRHPPLLPGARPLAPRLGGPCARPHPRG